MRGYVVAFDIEGARPRPSDDDLERSCARWLDRFAPGCVHRAEHPGCGVYLFTLRPAVPAHFNQRVSHTPAGLTLWSGPRVDITPEPLLRAPASHDAAALCAEVRASPCTLDTVVCVSYRTDTRSLAVKTDILNSSYVCWTQRGRWVLVSNSSLALAQITGAGLDAVAASEFLASGSIYGGASLYEGIRRFAPASVNVFAGGSGPQAQPYWRLEALAFNSVSAREACARVIEELDRDFKLLDASGRTFVLDLSGGYDSRTNVGFAARNLRSYQTTVSGVPGDEDVVLSSRLARSLGVKHTVIAPAAHDDPRQSERVADCALATDLEYDLLEYSRIYHAQTRFDSLREPSIHGSAGGDIARNIILRPEFCHGGPDGQVVLEPLIEQRFRNLIPASMSLPGLPIADWMAHAKHRIAEHDVPQLPAYVRLDIIYLRMRMQYWQGRVGSSTNRFRSSFSPWTNRNALEAMLTTHWRARDRQMLSRLFLRALHPQLSRVPIARGEAAGPTLWDSVAGMPRRMRYFAGRAAIRLGWKKTVADIDPALYRQFAPAWEAVVSRILKPEAVAALAAPGGLAAHPQVLGRLVTLAHVQRLSVP